MGFLRVNDIRLGIFLEKWRTSVESEGYETECFEIKHLNTEYFESMGPSLRTRGLGLFREAKKLYYKTRSTRIPLFFWTGYFENERYGNGCFASKQHVTTYHY